ncbi:C39 family peptidase [Thiofilum flexile]|uniref:C39 family peptidase n=1 Tax=Thiofilum flexile TaxID=125627 RepID=UPI0003610357|nr:C39 family peptidase [Thiofilum flexile]
MLHYPTLILISLALLVNNASADTNTPPNTVWMQTPSLNGSLPIQHWKARRDARVVKQDLDYSCGSASIATILTEYYRRPTTEQQILDLIVRHTGNKGRASFADMQAVLPQLGFKGIGVATDWEQLLELKLPVIVYVQQRKEDHFTVITGINDRLVKLADPSLGNRTLTRGQFKRLWETRNEQGLEGKMLAILPLDTQLEQQADSAFFTKPTFSPITQELLKRPQY